MDDLTETEVIISDSCPMILDVGLGVPKKEDTPGANRTAWRDVYRCVDYALALRDMCRYTSKAREHVVGRTLLYAHMHCRPIARS